MTDSKKNYKFDLEVEGLSSLLGLNSLSAYSFGFMSLMFDMQFFIRRVCRFIIQGMLQVIFYWGIFWMRFKAGFPLKIMCIAWLFIPWSQLELMQPAWSARKHMKVTKSKLSRDLVLVVHLIGQEGDFPLVFSILFHLRLPHWFPNFHDNPF